MDVLYSGHIDKPQVMDIYFVVDSEGDERSYWSTKEEAYNDMKEGETVESKKVVVRPLPKLH